MSHFTIDPLIASTSWSLCQMDDFEVRLVNDARYHWLLLIPRLQGITELHDLSPAMRHQMMELATSIGEILSTKTNADKMNIATIGNIVPAMHLHIIARYKTDSAWPNPVWGHGAPVPMDEAAALQKQTETKSWLDPVLSGDMAPNSDDKEE